MSASQNPKKRVAFTDIDRQCFRVYSRCNPGLTPPQLASWFESEFGRKVSNSSVYDILSDKYAYLDVAEATEAVRKKKGPQWAELEKALFEWWQNVQPRDVTGRELKARANEIWYTLPACQGKKPPTFSDGWLSNWRVRHGLRQLSKIMESEQIRSNVRVLDGEVMADSASRHQQSIAYPQYVGLMFQTAIPPFVQPPESRLHFDHLNIQSSSNQTDFTSQFYSTSPSIAKFYQTINSPDRGKRKQRSGELVLNAQHKAKRAKFMAIGQPDAIDFEHVVPCSVPAQSTIHISNTLWQGVKELFLNCTALNADRGIIAGDTIKVLFQPILDSLKVSRAWARQEHAALSDMEKAILLFAIAENFQLQQVQDKTKTVILEEWFLDAINPKVLRSQSAEPSSLHEKPSSGCNLAAVIPSRRAEVSNCPTAFVSPTAEGGKVIISTRRYRDLCVANNGDTTQHLRAKIVITPPTTSGAVPQTEVHLATRTRGCKTTLLTPIISFRNVIPMNSKVFRIARYGTSLKLQMMFSEGEASLTDCDPGGRSLINYALQSSNYSTLKFLITKVEDIDALEPIRDDRSDIRPLIGLLNGSLEFSFNIRHRDTMLECLKLMLLAEADPLLRTRGYMNTLNYALEYGTVAAIKTLLDLGLPYFTKDKFISDTSEPALLHLARSYSYLYYLSLHLHEKIFLFLERGTNIAVRTRSGETSLHLVLGMDEAISRVQFIAYQEDEFKDILMCMVTAGADVYASDYEGTTISQVACRNGHEGLWIEVLTECGYDPDDVFSLGDEFSPYHLRDVTGVGIFSAAAPAVRPTRLSFAEYSRYRKSLHCVQNVYSKELEDFVMKFRRVSEFWGSYIESSDSEDYEWVSVEGDDGDSDD